MSNSLNNTGLQPECIVAQKLFDWVIVRTERDFLVTLGEACLAAINAALALGQTVEGRATLISVACNIENISRVDDRIGRLILSKTAVVRVQFFNTSVTPNELLCDFVTEQLVTTERACVCLPPEFTLDNVTCDVFQSNVEVLGLPNANGIITVVTDFCQQITVEDIVRLEVMARYCHPRENDIECGSITCVFPAPPQQCPDIFPPADMA
jgi:hypothetical protein